MQSASCNLVHSESRSAVVLPRLTNPFWEVAELTSGLSGRCEALLRRPLKKSFHRAEKYSSSLHDVAKKTE